MYFLNKTTNYFFIQFLWQYFEMGESGGTTPPITPIFSNDERNLPTTTTKPEKAEKVFACDLDRMWFILIFTRNGHLNFFSFKNNYFVWKHILYTLVWKIVFFMCKMALVQKSETFGPNKSWKNDKVKTIFLSEKSIIPAVFLSERTFCPNIAKSIFCPKMS